MVHSNIHKNTNLGYNIIITIILLISIHSNRLKIIVHLLNILLLLLLLFNTRVLLKKRIIRCSR